MADPAVVVFDTTLRDGEQAPGFSMRVEEKIQLARQLDALGVDIMEAGFPIASQDDAESVRRVASEVRRPVIAALARCAPGDIDAAGKALEPAARSRIHTFIATSDLHLERKLRITREQCLERAVAAVTRARGFTDDVQFSAEDATRSDLGFLYQVVEAVIDAGATTINLPDTVGYCTPDEIERVLQRDHRRRCRTRRRRSSAPTATTISASRSPTAWPPSAPARARSSARSTASASGPATPRSRKS